MDSQWPRWEVFKKDSKKKPYQAVGSVHAVDPEHALLNARNVFVRRPSAVSLWVIPAAYIFGKTQEELEADPDWFEKEKAAVVRQQPFEIFRKSSHRRSMTFMDHVGRVEADSAQEALRQVLGEFGDEQAFAWWVVPSKEIISTDPDVGEAWFEPAKEKTYKQQSQYGFVSARRKGRSGRGDEKDE